VTREEDPRQVASFIALISSLLQNERALRADSEQQASENERLLAALRARQVLLERLAQLQRGIVDRLPVHEILEAVVEAASELVESRVGILWITDPGSLRGRRSHGRRRRAPGAPPPARRRGLGWPGDARAIAGRR
jgi:hypothetical protein